MHRRNYLKFSLIGKLAMTATIAHGANEDFYSSIYSNLERHEGRRSWVYDDLTSKRLYSGQTAKGNRTIGVGFHLDKDGAIQRINNLDLNYFKVRNGESPLTNPQIDTLLKDDVKIAENDVLKYLGRVTNLSGEKGVNLTVGKAYYEALPKDAKQVMIELSFPMGYNSLAGFNNLREALRAKDFIRAGEEIKDSSFYEKQTKRAGELANRMSAVRK